MSVSEHDFLTVDPRPRSNTSLRWHSSVQRVLVYMRGHLEEKQSSESLADVAALSRFHFNRVFRHVTGLPPAFFLAALRLEAAKCLLLKTDMSVTDVCLDVGYTSLGTFVSRFTELVGISPRALRYIARSMDGIDLRDYRALRPPVSAITCKSARSIIGRVIAPPGLSGMICVGLYDNVLPHARPLQCAALPGSGHFHFEHVAEGQYMIAAGALRPNIEVDSFLNSGVVLRAFSGPVNVTNSTVHTGDIMLRPTEPFDPPILAPLPAMLTFGEVEFGLRPANFSR